MNTVIHIGIDVHNLAKAAIPCVIMAPTTLPKAPGNHVKTDRIDAEGLARHLAWGTTVLYIYRPRKMKR